MPPVCRRLATISAPVILALGMSLNGLLPDKTSAGAAQQGVAGGHDSKPTVLAGEAATDTGPADKQGSDTEATDNLLIAQKSEERVQDGTTEWGADADQTFVSPRYVTRNFLTIRSKADTITIKAISVDRGNCPALVYGLPASMKFGGEIKIPVMCDPLEALVETDHGSYSFSWDE